jgi:hypothetical protein
VHDQLSIAAEKPCRVDAKRQIALDAGFAAVRDHRLGVTADPGAFHGSTIRKSRRRFSEWIMPHQTTVAVPSTAGEAF